MLINDYIRNKVESGLVDKGMAVSQALTTARSSLTDTFLQSVVADAGLTPPSGGVLQWLIANLPAILAIVEQLITLFNSTNANAKK